MKEDGNSSKSLDRNISVGTGNGESSNSGSPVPKEREITATKGMAALIGILILMAAY